jgi:hypothetical protein
MTSPPSTIPGWRLCQAAGFVPLLAGIVVFLTNWLNIARADSPWWTGVGTLGFTYHGLAGAGAGAAIYVALVGSIAGVNVVGAAVAVIVVARYGLRNGQRWAWWFLLFCLIWIGLHDAVMTTRFFAATGQPFMLLPLTYSTLLLAGLLRSRRTVFSARG